MSKEKKIILGIVNDENGYTVYMYENKIGAKYLVDFFKVDKILLSIEIIKEANKNIKK